MNRRLLREYRRAKDIDGPAKDKQIKRSRKRKPKVSTKAKRPTRKKTSTRRKT